MGLALLIVVLATLAERAFGLHDAQYIAAAAYLAFVLGCLRGIGRREAILLSVAALLTALAILWRDDPVTPVLQGLDKITARISTFEAPVEQPVVFGSLEIMVRTCQKRPPEEPPESAAFLEITEQKPGEAASRLFTGWMFASSPALNGLQHPVYDVWLLDCKRAE